MDDNIFFRWNLMEALGRQGLEIVEEASNGYEGADKALALRPDIVLSDLHMPGSDGIAATQVLQEKAPEIKVLILTVSDKDESLLAALNSGARGYLLKNENIDMIAKAINYVALGGIVISPSMANKLQVDFGSPTPGVGGSTSTAAPGAGVEESKSPPPPVEIPEAVDGDASPEEQAIDSKEPTRADAGLTEYEPTREHALVFTAPVEPALILTLLHLLAERTDCIVGRVDPSLVADTVVQVIHKQPIGLGSTLAEMPLVARVTGEPSPARRDARKRLRLTLKYD